MEMKCNIGRTDKIIRLLVGLGIVAAGLVTGSWWGLIGLIPLATAIFGRCGLYYPLGISTIEKK